MSHASLAIVGLFGLSILIILYLLVKIRVELQIHAERLSNQQITSQRLQNNVCDLLNSTNAYLSQILDCPINQNKPNTEERLPKPKKFKPKRFS